MIKLPIPFTETLKSQLGEDYIAFEASLSTESPTSIRLHPSKSTHVKSKNTDTVPWNPLGIYLPQRPSFTHDPLFQAGAYYVQEASSMSLLLALESLQVEGALKILDLCAAPGGKSTLALDFLFTRNHPGDYIVCNEVISSRANILAENIVKWGYSNAIVCSHDPKSLAEKLGTFFDVIIADCPCSGEGLFRKDEKARNEWSEDNVQLCDLRQKRILNEADRLLKPGGHIIYSTCTYNSAENINQIQYMVENSSYESKSIKSLQELGVTTVEKSSAVGYQFYPHLLKGEGLFISVLQKNKDALWNTIKQKISKEKGKKKITLDFIPSKFEIIESKLGQLHVMEKEIAHDFKVFSEILYLKSMGTEIGIIKNSDFIPSHPLALSFELESPYESVEVDQETALEFLKKNPISLNCNIGWKLIKYKGLGLGWIKKLPNRINNYYPKNLRILHEERKG